MKFRKFKKNNKRNTMIIITVVIVVGLVVSTTLIESHANFKTTKTFNIIQGKIPNKNNGDIKLAYLVDNEPSNTLPEKNTGYHFVGSECTNDASLTWNTVSWSANVSGLKEKGTVCIIKFETGDLTFNYGDGSLNTVARTCKIADNGFCQELDNNKGGYNGKIWLYNYETGIDSKLSSYNYAYTGNNNYDDVPLNALFNLASPPEVTKDTSSITVKAGENIFNVSPITDDKSTIYLNFWYGNAGGPHTVSDLQIFLDDKYYTLKDAVSNKKIKPLVLMSSFYYESPTSNWIGDNATLLYNGGSTTGYFFFPRVYFMLEKGVAFRGIKFNSKNAMSNGGGRILIQFAKNQILHLNN